MNTPADEGTRAARIDDNKRSRLQLLAARSLKMQTEATLIDMVINRMTDEELTVYDTETDDEPIVPDVSVDWKASPSEVVEAINLALEADEIRFSFTEIESDCDIAQFLLCQDPE